MAVNQKMLYSEFHRFRQARICLRWFDLSSSHFSLLPQPPPKTTLVIKVVKIDLKIVVLFLWSKSVKQTVQSYAVIMIAVITITVITIMVITNKILSYSWCQVKLWSMNFHGYNESRLKRTCFAGSREFIITKLIYLHLDCAWTIFWLNTVLFSLLINIVKFKLG